MATDEADFVLRLRALKDRTPAVQRLRAFLKAALRSYRLRCVEVGVVRPGGEVVPLPGEGPGGAQDRAGGAASSSESITWTEGLEL
jgi:hypothetical protein